MAKSKMLKAHVSMEQVQEEIAKEVTTHEKAVMDIEQQSEEKHIQTEDLEVVPNLEEYTQTPKDEPVRNVELIIGTTLFWIDSGTDDYRILTEEQFKKNQEFDASKPTCPYCNRKMTLRDGVNGLFWGCTSYPVCKYTENY